jgi:hypothetical protein
MTRSNVFAVIGACVIGAVAAVPVWLLIVGAMWAFGAVFHHPHPTVAALPNCLDLTVIPANTACSFTDPVGRTSAELARRAARVTVEDGVTTYWFDHEHRP